MKRIQELDPADLTSAQREVYDAIANGPRKGVRGPLAVWLHRPELASRAQALGSYCRYGSCLSPRLSELAILTMARYWGAEYEWYAHSPIAAEAGISAAAIESIRCGLTPVLASPEEQVVHEFVDTLNRHRQIPPALYQRATELLGESGVIDLVGVAGYYTLISMTINVFGVSPPDGTPLAFGEAGVPDQSSNS
jgi:4-carboxymuconolactone decarboxylase